MNPDNNDYAEYRKIRSQIVCNDPSLTKLTVVGRGRIDSGAPHGPGYFFSVDEEWEEDGKCIGKNTNVEELIIEEEFHRIADRDLEIFLRGVAKNRSIRKLTFNGCDLNGGIFPILVRFFKNNANFEFLAILPGVALDPGGDEKVASALAAFDSLKEFIYNGVFDFMNNGHAFYEEDVNTATRFIHSLAGHTGLKKLDLTYAKLGMIGSSRLAVILKNQTSRLDALDLSHNEMDDGMAVALSAGLSHNRTLKKINLACINDITSTGWMTIFDALKGRNCRVEELNLSQNSFDNNVRISLANYLANNSALKSLDLSFNRPAVTAGWGDLFAAFQSPTSALEKINLASNSIDDYAANALTNALVTNNKLKELNLRSNPQITTMEWENFLSILQNPNSSLEKLNLSSNSVGDDAVISLTNALVNNKKLRELDLNRNHMITFMGWETFLAVLRSPNSALEKLNLDANLFNDAAILSLASSLANNRKLKELVLVSQWHQPNITAGWGAFSQLLCDTSSILDTYLSNHTLQTLSKDDNRSVPRDVRQLLQVNQGNSKRQAARVKIVQAHFSDGFTEQPFVEMDSKVLPHAISWMGRDGKSNAINENHYGFLRSMPSLFDRK